MWHKWYETALTFLSAFEFTPPSDSFICLRCRLIILISRLFYTFAASYRTPRQQNTRLITTTAALVFQTFGERCRWWLKIDIWFILSRAWVPLYLIFQPYHFCPSLTTQWYTRWQVDDTLRCYSWHTVYEGWWLRQKDYLALYLYSRICDTRPTRASLLFLFNFSNDSPSLSNAFTEAGLPEKAAFTFGHYYSIRLFLDAIIEMLEATENNTATHLFIEMILGTNAFAAYFKNTKLDDWGLFPDFIRLSRVECVQACLLHCLLPRAKGLFDYMIYINVFNKGHRHDRFTFPALSPRERYTTIDIMRLF